MTFYEALLIANSNSSLIGTFINGEKVDDILIIPTDVDELKAYIDTYIATLNPQQAIIPFISSDVKVVVLFKRDYLVRFGIFTTIDL